MKKKIAPILVVLGLIVLVLGAGVVTMLVKRYAPSKERMDGKVYFDLKEEDDVALVINGEVVEEKAKKIDDRYYIKDTVVGKYINDRFYWDQKQNQMLYALPTEELQFSPDKNEYQTEQGIKTTEYTILKAYQGAYYLELEFIKQFVDMDCEVIENPSRIVIRTTWDNLSTVDVKKESPIRQKGGIKSIIVDTVEKGETLFLQEELENWSKVSTKDGYTGYIEKEDISQPVKIAVDRAFQAPVYTNIKREHKINMAWHQVTSLAGNETLNTVTANAQNLNVISPTWFSVVDNNGTISSLASSDYVKQAHAKGMEVWGLIDNFNRETNTLTFLSDTNARWNIIRQLMAQADAVGLDGINLDFESITEEQGPHYVQFIRELSIACRRKGLVFSIDNPVPKPYGMHYNRREQGIVADYVIVMGYDEHYSGSEQAGSVASLEFVREGIENTLKEVPAEKVINAIPFYTRVWIEPFGGGNMTSEVLGMDGTMRYIQEKHMDVYWDEDFGQNVAMAEGEDALYSIWVEDEQSIAEKMKLVQEHNLAGVAAWKLGFERASIWAVISQYLQ